jgi:signal transduction histidine kinase
VTPLRRALVALAVAGLAAGGLAAAVVLGSNHTTQRGLIAATSLAVGWAFVGTGLFAWWRRPDNRFGALMTAVGFAWLLCALTAADRPLLYTVGVLVSAVHYAVVAHMLLAFPSGRLPGARERALVAFVWVLVLPAQALWMLFWSPARDGCRCPDNLLAVADRPALAGAIGGATSLLGLAATLAVVGLLLERWRAATIPQRRVLAPVLWSGFATGVMYALEVGSRFADAPALLQDGAHAAGHAFFLLVPFAFLLGLLRARVTQADALDRLMARLSATPGRGELRDALAQALGDRSLALYYWLPGSSRYVDAGGRPAPALPGAGPGARAATEIEHDGRRVAAIVHDASLVEEAGLVRGAGAAAALALEHDRLEAELRARIEELRVSRTRIVEAADAERRRLERNLHDGAQQRLVALGLTLGLARGRVERDPALAAALVGEARAELDAARDELRELAAGLHPAVLAEQGLAAALRALADRSPLPVDLQLDGAPELPPRAAATAYYVASEALANMAKHAHATRAAVRLSGGDGGGAVVEVADDGIGGADPGRGSGLRGLAERVEALRGRLAVHSPPGGGTRIRAEVPCGS